jgi:hypothetical protein
MFYVKPIDNFTIDFVSMRYSKFGSMLVYFYNFFSEFRNQNDIVLTVKVDCGVHDTIKSTFVP